jgi:hypothetical protein
MTSSLLNNKKVVYGVLSTPSANMQSYYDKMQESKYAINGSLNGTDSKFDWLSVRTHDSKYVKSGVLKNQDNKEYITVNFDNPFQSNQYNTFFSSNKNVHMKWTDKRTNKFTIQGSSNLGTEISWIAIHKNFCLTTGIISPGSIYCGQREISTTTATSADMTNPSHSNGVSWRDSEYIINPLFQAEPDKFTTNMNMEQYSIILSTDSDINIFWKEKSNTKVKIGTSYPLTGIKVDFLIVKIGVNWWEEL